MYLLIDAGGTSTKGFLYDGKEIISQHRGPPGSVSTVGFQSSVLAIEEVVRRYGERFDGISIALAGTDVMENLLKARRLIEEKLKQYASKVVVEHDAHVVLLSNSEVGCSVIVGTGSIVYCFDGKRRVIKGDRGWLVGDPCSGFYLGREYLSVLLKQFQGLRRKSQILRESGFKTEDELVKFLYENSCNQDKIASFSLKLISCVERDPQAKSVLYRGLEDLWRATRLAVSSSGQSSLYYFGGLFSSSTFEREFVNFVLKKAEKNRIKLYLKKSNQITNGLMRLLEL